MKKRLEERAQSGVIVTVLMVLVVLAAVVIVWNVVKYAVKEKSEEIFIKQLAINLEVSSVYISEDDKEAYVSVERSAGGGEISALDFIFTGSSYVYRYPIPNGIPNELENKVYNITAYAVRLQNPDFINFSSIKSVSIAFEMVSVKKTFLSPVKDEFKEDLRSDTSLPSKYDPEAAPVYEGGGGCSEGAIMQCGSTDIGECQYGNQTCSGGVWGSCVGNIEPVTEICGDGLDSNCNGIADPSDPECTGSCAGTDISCGTGSPCANCNSFDGCIGTSYRNSSCSGISCVNTTTSCTDCSCQCGGYGVTESGSYCIDGIDNDCDANTDCGGSCITGTETGFCTDSSDNDKDCSVDCDDTDCFSDPACAGGIPGDYVSWWKFETQIGGITPDEKGVNNGTLMNDSYIENDIAKGNVLKTDGNNDYVNIGAFDETENLNEFTISYWVKAAVADDTSIRYVFYKSSNMYMYRSSSEYYYFIVSNDTSAVSRGTYLAPKDTNWHHIVAIYNGTDVFTYIDMNKSALTKFSGETRETTSSFTISIASTTSAFNGSIDDFMFYNRELSSSEIQQIYNAQMP